MGADMIKLLDDGAAVILHLFGDAAKVGDDGIVIGQEVAAGQNRRAMDRHRFDHDHARTAPGALAVVAKVPLAGNALFAHVGGMGAEHDAVLQREMTQPQRRKELGIGFGHGTKANCREMTNEPSVSFCPDERAKT